ncbi:MAG: hypothetical protein ACTH3E_09035 [Psychroflexus halocasei]|nr:hypothetical protein [Lactococcus lactis]
MATIDNLRNELIDKILSIKNENLLIALDQIITSSSTNSEIIELSREQKAMLKMSESDIENERLISQEKMDKRNLEWLNEL